MKTEVEETELEEAAWRQRLDSTEKDEEKETGPKEGSPHFLLHQRLGVYQVTGKYVVSENL